MRTVIYILLLATLIGCQKRGRNLSEEPMEHVEDTTAIELTIDLNKIPAVPFDSLMDDVKFVRLQTDERCLIGVVNQMVCTDDYIFVMDREMAKSVFCFDMQGRFVRKIGQEGEGPEEYIRLCNIALSADKKHLVIVDWAAKLLYYDFVGDLKKTVRLGTGTNHFEAIEEVDEQLIAGFTNSGLSEEETRPMLYVATNSEKQEIQYRALPTYQTKLFRINNGMFPFRKYGDDVYLNRPWTESFYKVGTNGCTKLYQLDIVGGGYLEITKDINDNTYIELLNRTVTLGDYVFCKDVSVFFFSVPKIYWHPFVVHNRKTGSMLRCSGKYTNPLFEFYSTLNTPLARLGDNTYVVQQSADRVLSLKKRVYNSPLIQDETLEKLYDGLTEDSNPVLFFYHLRH
ncbi:6-bladed beta-propeller [uncultured Bacteroides sp.]|uniref:6-bladed beta-propeller n=1 Tax=uncultured Bacteroides sp. TaxID=162156 RepID=UPI0032B1C1DD